MGDYVATKQGVLKRAEGLLRRVAAPWCTNCHSPFIKRGPSWFCKGCRVTYCPLVVVDRVGPHCLQCKRMMASHSKRWVCTKCGIMCLKQHSADIYSVTQQKFTGRPWCIYCRKVMVHGLRGRAKREIWVCKSCNRDVARYGLPYACNGVPFSTDNPFCIKCRKRMWVAYSGGSHRTGRWKCGICKAVCPKQQSNPLPIHPWCLSCRKELRSGGHKGGRSWECRQCGFSVKAHYKKPHTPTSLHPKKYEGRPDCLKCRKAMYHALDRKSKNHEIWRCRVCYIRVPCFSHAPLSFTHKELAA